MNSQFVENVEIPDSQNSSELSENDSNLSNHRRKSRLRQPSSERSIIAERQYTQAAEKIRRYRRRIHTNRDVNSQSFANVDSPNSQNSSEFIGNNSHLSDRRSR